MIRFYAEICNCCRLGYGAEDQITHLKEEINYLKKVLDKLLND